MTWASRAAAALQKYSSSQPRDKYGKWTAGGGGNTGSASQSGSGSNASADRANSDDGPGGTSHSNIGQGEGHSFVSPVVANSDFAGVLTGLTSDRYKALLQASSFVDGALGINGHDSSVIGAWADGAENSVMTTVHNADWNLLKLAGAMKDALADQKAVLIFQQQHGGDHRLFDFHATDDLTSIHKNLLADGLAFHTR